MQIPGYRIIRKINQGGMSTVYLAIQQSVRREVALKVMSPVLNANPIFSERFQREASIIGQLSHPNIVSIYDIGRYKNLNYIAMDYLPGGTVHDKMVTGLSPAEALRITREIALALDHAHDKGYIHRDIKPENILFREDDSAVLSDFGVAKTVITASRMTNAGIVVGTPHYMSPEQARGKAIDGRADIYSLGVVFYEMLTGSVPYNAEEAVAIAIKHLTAPTPRLPPQHAIFQKVLNRLLAKEADKRFRRGKEVVAALDEVEKNLFGVQPNCLNTIDSTNVQLVALFKALLSAGYAALMLNIRELMGYLLSWRWAPKRGLYRSRNRLVTEIRRLPNTLNNRKTTQLSTRIQKAIHYQKTSQKYLYFSRSLAFATVISVIWCALSVALKRFELPGESLLPASITEPSTFTADFIERHSARLFAAETTFAKTTFAKTTLAKTTFAISDTPGANRIISTAEQLDEKLHLAETLSDADSIPKSLSPSPTSTPSVAKRYGFTVQPRPQDARVRILNIKEKYYPGIALFPGAYHIEVTRRGYERQRKWIRLAHQDLAVPVQLDKTLAPGDSLFHTLGVGTPGPEIHQRHQAPAAGR